MTYVELHARSAFSFLRGASQPEQLAEHAAHLDLPAAALCDRDGVYGSARFHAAAKVTGIRAIVGSELTMEDGAVLPVLVANRAGYRNLCRLISRAKLRGTGFQPVRPAPILGAVEWKQRQGLPLAAQVGNLCYDRKAGTPIRWDELAEFAHGLVALTGDEEGPVRSALAREDRATARHATERLTAAFGKENVFIEIQRHLRRGEERENDALRDLAAATGLPLLATNGVLHANRDERTVLDVFTCARNHTHLDAAGCLLAANDERHLKPASRMARLFARTPEAIANTVRLAERLEFTLEDLGYEFPRYRVPEGETMDSFLHKITMAGARARYGHLSPPVLRQLEHELGLIARLGFSGYFLIVWDLVNFCTAQGILVQGRGSAANSAVCYSLGITACDPIACRLLFERFLSEGRKSWPDIDLDLPSGDRRERVIQEVYRRYGPDGAAMTANVITFRGRSAMREIGKALNFSPDVLDRFSRLFSGGDFPHTLGLDAQLRQAGIPLEHPRTAAAVALYQRIYGLPRHLGQHSGGMIICQGQLNGIVPLENASMPGRVVAQWDKDDCEDLGIIKVDLLGLGMMAAMQDALEMCQSRGRPVDLATIPKDDASTYDLMCRADTIGVFQIESRAQMTTLPRMKPRCFYDVVVEVAIIRPGPIQGGLVHPFLARRQGREPVTYFDERLRPVLERTLGVPLFQEQLLKIAMVMADFTGSEAEELRRALSFHRSQERMNKVCVKMRASMERNGVAPEIVENIVSAVQSFAVYGFPESHAISFALITYASSWMKVHRAPEFYCGLLNNQPMGFYSPDTLVRDAKRHGVQVLAVNVACSEWLCTIEEENNVQRPRAPARGAGCSSENEAASAASAALDVGRWALDVGRCAEGGALRLGLCHVRGLARGDGERIAAERKRAPFTSLADFQLRTALPKTALRTLAKIGALNGLADHRRAAQWQVETHRDPDDLFATIETHRAIPLAAMQPIERTSADLAGTGMSTGPHPMAHLRASLPDVWRAADLGTAPQGASVRIAGLVICRQRPGTAKGFVFVSLEDETGVANAILTPALFEKRRLTICEEPFLSIEGAVQNTDGHTLIKARRVTALPVTAGALPASHDFQ
jgi:error-prone DNA polymerase